MFFLCVMLFRSCNLLGRISQILTLQWGGSIGPPFPLNGLPTLTDYVRDPRLQY